MRFTWCALIVSLLLSPLAAQKADLKLDELKSKAKETEEQNLEGAEVESFLNTQLTALEAAARASRAPSRPRSPLRSTRRSNSFAEWPLF